MKWSLLFGVAALLTSLPARAQSVCEEQSRLDDPLMTCYYQGSEELPDPFKLRMLKYTALEVQHRVAGLASYYSASLAGTLTANGEHYRPKEMTAAHLTLPLGTWVELKSRATGKVVRVRVNDRGPYVKKFAIDLSRAAASALGVDVAEDRWVDMRIIALPGEDPLPEAVLTAAAP